MAWTDSSALVAPANPFVVPPPQMATCASALEKPIRLGAWTNTQLEPFDDANLLQREISEMRWCRDKPMKADDPPVIKECAACDYGYRLPKGGKGPLECREAPSCSGDGGACQSCVASPLTPWLVQPCQACISYGCDAEAGRCACFTY